MMDTGSEFTSPPLLLSTLNVHIKPDSRKVVQSITVDSGAVRRQICKAISPGGRHLEWFNPPLEILVHNKISVSIHYRHGIWSGVVPISLDPETVLHGANETDGKQVYFTTERKVELAIGIQSLPMTVREIVASCDRFRLLILGKSGVGKTSLINKVFGVSNVNASHTERGQAAIDQEHTALDNNRFVVHDSCGFEAAECGNLDTVRNFIKGRRRMRHLKDRLHAVWLCMDVPFAGSRVVETGVEEFLRDRDQILGEVPLVVVFTKLDSLVDMLKAEALQANELLDDDTLQKRTQELLEERCLVPLRKAAGNDKVPHAFVSTKDGYEDSLSSLIEKTTQNIRTYVKDEAPQYIAAIAQRVSISLKVEATIAVGSRKYWKMLKASPNFKGHTMKECLDVLHNDIIMVWNFRDPQRKLDGESFKGSLFNRPDLRVGGIEDTSEAAQSLVSVVKGLVAVINGIGLAGIVGGAAFPIIVPAAAGVIILGGLARCLYKSSQDVVKQLMAYIVDLTCVMQVLFLIATVKQGEVSDEAITMTMQAYEGAYRRKVHTDINDFPVHLAIAPGKRDEVLDKIKELICKYSLSDKDIFELQHQLNGSAEVPSRSHL